jgi:hypothetical protein
MGSALYIVLEKEIPGLDLNIDGKMLSKAEEALAEAAERLGVCPLMEFFGASEEGMAQLPDEDTAGIDIPTAEWFDAEEGLKTVDALLREVDRSPEIKAAKDDLLGCQRILREAQKHGVRWHLAVDF